MPTSNFTWIDTEKKREREREWDIYRKKKRESYQRISGSEKERKIKHVM